jgi:Flp pilus assembly protein TadG
MGNEKRYFCVTPAPRRSRERVYLLTQAKCGNRPGARWAPEKGAEVLEFAIVLPVLLALLFGIFTMARAYNIYQTITRAAREGAREAVLPSSAANGNQYMDASGVSQANSAVFQNYIAPALRAASLNPANVTNYSEQITWLDAGDASQQCGVKISFQYPYTLFLPMLTSNMTTILIATHVQMRRENQPSSGTCP